MKMNKKVKTIGIVSIFIFVLNVYIIVHNNPLADQTQELLKKIVSCVILDIIYFFFIKYYDKMVILPVELYQNRKLIWKLARSDFKTRYAGSYLGIFWAFVQPIVTIVVYWFVFQIGLRSGDVGDTPFVLWLVAGLIPWFFFSEALGGGTGAMLEYNYLVKKVVFKISILQNYFRLVCTFVFCCLCRFAFCLLSFRARFIYTASILLYLLFVCFCSGALLYYMFCRCLF